MGLAWPGTDQVSLVIGTITCTQVVAGKDPMAVTIWRGTSNGSKVGRSLGLKLLSKDIFHCIKRDTRTMQDRNSNILVAAFPGRGLGDLVTADCQCPSNLHSKY
jgi:hypothetical protein